MRSLILGALLVGACGSDLTRDQACTDVSQARCTQLMTCSAADVQRRWGDQATCEAREKLACMDSLAAPATAATPATVQACATALTQTTCDAFLSGVEPPAECLPQSGPTANGGACAFNAQCKSGFCAVASDALCGTCAVPPAAGDSCAANGCSVTMTCVAATQQCQAPVAAGGACSRALPCEAGLACVGATTTTTGTCQAEVTMAGAACDPRRMTGPDCSAGAGLTCDTTARQCVTQPVAAAGQPCGLIGTVETRCGGGATCSIPATGGAGICVAPAADGAACDATNGPGCLFPARCVAGTCQLPGAMTCG